MTPRFLRRRRYAQAVLLAVLLLGVGFAPKAAAHPLGNFTINHFARLTVGGERVHLRYVVDMAEIPTFQTLQAMGRTGAHPPSSADLRAFSGRAAAQYAPNLRLAVDGARVPLTPAAAGAVTLPGAGGLPTLRVECDFTAAVPAGLPGAAHRLQFDDANEKDRIGWREIVIVPASGVTVFNSSAYGNAVTNELKAYPKDMIAAPLSERAASLSWTRGGAPRGATLLRRRDGRAVVPTARDRFAELIAVKTITPAVALLGLLFAFLWGAGHAFSPGHGKTVVGAYLIGARGTARHAVFLGLTVTITHTLGVFALGLVTLFAARSIVPDRLYPILTFVSGALVAGIGLSLFAQRLRSVLGHAAHAHDHGDAPVHDHSHNHAHTHDHEHSHDHAHEHIHSHDHAPLGMHSHGGVMHSHLPPGADGSHVTWRSLLALGISGGLLPCPSALLVLLAAVSLHRIGYGLVLVFGFSLGLAATLTGIGLAFVYAGRRFSRLAERPTGSVARLARALPIARLARVLPVASALVISLAGAAICYGAVQSLGLRFSAPPPQPTAGREGQARQVSLAGKRPLEASTPGVERMTGVKE